MQCLSALNGGSAVLCMCASAGWICVRSLRILHRETGEVCAVLEEEALNELQDQGDLDVNGLSSSEPGVLKEVVRNLFLFCYARALRPATELNGKFHP